MLLMDGTMTIDTRAAGSVPSSALNRYPFFAYRIWYGMRVAVLLSLLTRNHFAVSPARIAFVFRGFVCSLVNSGGNIVQRLIFGKRVRECVLDAQPIFIIGHWRTGTTLLHELLTLDERHTYPTTYECLEPNHFLLTETFFQRWMRFLLPSHRPMDNMPAGWERPQEDEFALCMLGQPSPYLAIAFPNSSRGKSHALELDLKP